MYVQINLRLSRELLRLAEYLSEMEDDTVTFRKLINDGHSEAYLLCSYLGQIGFIHVKQGYIGISKDVRQSLLNHARDVLELYSDEKRDRDLSNLEKEKNIRYAKRGFRTAVVAILISIATFIWQIAEKKGWI